MIKLLLLFCLATEVISIWFIPGENCGITNEIRSLKHLPDDFNGDYSELDCTIVKASIPEWKFSAWTQCTATCGGGIKQRKTECIDSLGKLYDNLSCSDGYQTQNLACNEYECPVLEPEYTKVVVIKGERVDGSFPSENVEVVDLASTTTSCENLPAFPVDTFWRTALLYKDTIVSCAGGDESSVTENLKCHRYDEDAMTWTHITTLPDEYTSGRQSSVIGGKIFISGGFRSGSNHWTDTWVWDGTSLTEGPPLAIGCLYATHCQLAVNETHIFEAESDTISSVSAGEAFLLEWETGEWTTLSPMPTETYARIGTSCALTQSEQRGTEIFVLGYDLFLKNGVTMVYNLALDAWRVGPTYGKPYDNMYISVAQLKYTFLVFAKTEILKYVPADDGFVQLPQVLSEVTKYSSAIAVPDDFVTCN